MIYDLQSQAFFYELLKGANIILADFWSRRCEHCRLTAPAVDYIHSQYADEITLLKIEIEKFPYLASKYKISALPIQLLFKGGEKIKEYAGVETMDMKISEIAADIEKLMLE